MPLSDYRTLSLEGLNIDECDRGYSVLKAKLADGYEAGLMVGEDEGDHRWVLSSGVWPDNWSYTVEGVPWMEYYWSFFQSHVSAGQKPFLVEWRGRLYFASFEEAEIGVEVFSSNLFAPTGVTIYQRRVRGYPDLTDGSVADA